ncbi:MAG: hypothetical protein HY721_26930, partial [Planctomycetes bacterium]|nr:hypothetical protein [Planctomycetota bacterium]
GDLVLELASVLGERAREDKAWERFRSFFPEIVPDGVKERLQKRGVLAVTQIHRNLAQWWENREALLDAKAAGDLIQFSQVMSIVFGGRNFQDEILPELGPTVTIVACNQEYKDLPAKPQPAIPAFAGIFELKNAADASKDMVAAFYTLVGIINADRAQKKKEGGMSMIPRPEKVGDVDMHTVSLNLQKDAKPGLPHNFTPSMAVVGSRVVLSSSTELAKILVEELSKVSEPKTGAAGAKDSIVIDARAVHGILTDNLDVIVADNMLKNGKSRAEAEGELKAALEILPSLKDLRIESWRKDGAVRARAELRTSFGSKAVKAEPAKAGEKKTVKL